jgi:predicted ATPase
MNHLFLLTGGPGSGKTSTLELLHQRGYQVVPEVARAIIQEQAAVGGNATHSGDLVLFCRYMLDQSIKDYQQMAKSKEPVFFDRGIPDLYAYSQHFCNKQDETILNVARNHPYNVTGFIFPPWPEIYTQDSERKQDFSEAIETYEVIKIAYHTLGYDLIEVPKKTISERANFIIATLHSRAQGND